MQTAFPRAFMRLSGILVAALISGAASAHATFEVPTATQNTTYKAVLRIPHGCDGQPTQVVRITIPEGIIAVKPMPKAGWTMDVKIGDYTRGYTLHGREVSSGAKEIIWAGGSLADGHYDEFVFQAQITDALPANETVYLPVIQECATAKAAWNEIPAKGQDAHALKAPAPGIRILAQARTGSGHDHRSPNAPSYRIGALIVEQPWTRATPGGARVAGGFMKITNTGKEPDRLIGGTTDIARVFEVHEMTMDGKMMKMRALAQGLEIRPGATAELKPGGYHVMFIDLKAPVKMGAPLKGELVFEKAGRLAVEYRVEPIGASQSGGHKH